MTKEGSTQIVNLISPGAGVLVLGCGHLSHILKRHYFKVRGCGAVDSSAPKRSALAVSITGPRR